MSFLQSLVDFITLSIITIALLIFSFLWILKLFIKREREYLFRALLIFIFVLLAFIFFQKSEIGQWNYQQIKDHIFPAKTIHLKYHVEKSSSFNDNYKRYVFEEPRPKLILSLDKKGQYLNLHNISPVNRVLKALGLPPVTSGVPELASITGSRFDVNHYRWDNYPEGILIIEKTRCSNKKTFKSYDCIAALTIRHRY